MLSLRDDAQLLLRLPAERIPDVLPLAGATLDVGGALFTMGAPRVFALRPAATLDARLVVIKLTDPPHRLNAELNRDALNVAGFADRYQAELKRQLAALDIHSPAELCGRASITVAGKRIVGYSVRVADLSADQSLRLQAAGLGGKRRMGCGMFRATRGA
jgi:CRISPR-associated protein Cas6